MEILNKNQKVMLGIIVIIMMGFIGYYSITKIRKIFL